MARSLESTANGRWTRRWRMCFMLTIALVAVPLHLGAQGNDRDRPVARTTDLMQGAEACRPAAANSDAPALLRRAIDVVGLDEKMGQVLHLRAAASLVQNFQSERTYPPFFSLVRLTEAWFDPATGAVRTEAEVIFPGFGRNTSPAVLQDERAAFIVNDTTLVPAPAGVGADVLYPLNAWAVLHAWRDDPEVRVAAQCEYRDYWRTVLTRPGRHGDERLYLDDKTGFPVKLDRQEPHYLWGQVHVEYLYSLWETFEAAFLPRAVFRLVDGETEISRTVSSARFMARDEAPNVDVPAAPPMVADERPLFLRPTRPDTVRVADDLYLLSNRGYTEAVALVNDTVFVFDATQAEERARHDEDWVHKLFPGEHPVVVVVTDLAWPHIAGVRYWVSQGATIASHRMSEDFLRRVVERRWTLEPDQLERRRDQVRFRFVGIDERKAMAGGGVQLAPIDGIGTEGALVAYLPRQRFLWASDYIQSIDRPTAYTTEVWRAAERAGFNPLQTAAQHLPLTPWEAVTDVRIRED